MAHKIKNTWYADFRFNGERIRRRSPKNTRADAKAYEATLRSQLTRGEDISREAQKASHKHMFEDFAWKWFEEYVVTNNKHQEQRMKTYILRSYLIPFFGKMPIEKITTRDVERYKVHALKEGVSRKTVNNRLAVLGKCIRTAYEWLEIQRMPPKIVHLKCPPSPINYLSADECTLLLSSAEGIVREMMLTALRTAMRQGELRALQWSSINWEGPTMTVRHNLNDRTKELESPKSNREHHIPIHTDVYEILFKRKKATGFVFSNDDGTPFDSQHIIRQLNKVREKAGMRKFTWHTLRHTFASHLAMKGASLIAIKELLGHSDIKMTMRYAHLAPSTLRTTIDLLSPKSAMHTDVGQRAGSQWIPAIQRETENA
ncbi:MAG: site-specific integrase [Minisyncoccia bacterium]